MKTHKIKVHHLLVSLFLLLGINTTTIAAQENITTQANMNADTNSIALAEQNEQNKVSINTAGIAELSKKLSGIGMKKAQNIVDYREKYGEFTKIEQLKEVSGISQILFDRNVNLLKL